MSDSIYMAKQAAGSAHHIPSPDASTAHEEGFAGSVQEPLE